MENKSFITILKVILIVFGILLILTLILFLVKNPNFGKSITYFDKGNYINKSAPDGLGSRVNQSALKENITNLMCESSYDCLSEDLPEKRYACIGGLCTHVECEHSYNCGDENGDHLDCVDYKCVNMEKKCRKAVEEDFNYKNSSCIYYPKEITQMYSDEIYARANSCWCADYKIIPEKRIKRNYSIEVIEEKRKLLREIEFELIERPDYLLGNGTALINRTNFDMINITYYNKEEIK